MAQLLVRNVSEKVKERLKRRASNNGRSLEAEVREILEDAAKSKPTTAEHAAATNEKGFGTLMQERFAGHGLTANERRRFNIGISELNDRSTMNMPDFES